MDTYESYESCTKLMAEAAKKRTAEVEEAVQVSGLELECTETTCAHLETIDDGSVELCVECGEEIKFTIRHEKDWNFYGVSDTKNVSDPSRVARRKFDERNIYKDVDNMGFTDKVVDIANGIYMQVTKGKIKRGNSRKAIVFASIYLAFIQTDNPETHENLIRVFNLSRKTGLQGLKHVKLNMPKGHDVHLVHITPVHLIKDIMESFKANEEQKTEIIELYNDIKNRHTKLNRARPQSVAAGVTYYWICANKIGITLRDFSKKVNLSELTIGKMAKLISNIVKRSNEAAAAVAMVATTAAVSDP